jgi:hypothetical protein
MKAANTTVRARFAAGEDGRSDTAALPGVEGDRMKLPAVERAEGATVGSFTRSVSPR